MISILNNHWYLRASSHWFKLTPTISQSPFIFPWMTAVWFLWPTVLPIMVINIIKTITRPIASCLTLNHCQLFPWQIKWSLRVVFMRRRREWTFKNWISSSKSPEVSTPVTLWERILSIRGTEDDYTFVWRCLDMFQRTLIWYHSSVTWNVSVSVNMKRM